MNVRKRRGFKSGYSIWLGLFPARAIQGALTDVDGWSLYPLLSKTYPKKI
jgi:hypothetical protein